MANKNDSYSKSGVGYSSIDPIKVLAQKLAVSTSDNLKNFEAKEIAASRGESAYVWEEADAYRALVIEGLGTKNLVADEMRKISGKSYYDQLAQDTVAMIVNDLVCVGALPQVINAYFGIGDSKWLEDKQRASDLVTGWAKACQMSGAVWGGGETPVLKGVINPATIDLAGSSVGIIKPKDRLVLGDKLQIGDAIVLIGSSGIHANGLTLARKVADGLPDGYATKLEDSRLYGEALLTPTNIYVDLVRSLLEQNLDIHYMVNITGHGWRKLMRATQPFSYVIEQVSEPTAEFKFIQKQAGISDQEMYGTFNMGAGFAVMLPVGDADQVLQTAKKLNLQAWTAGKVEAGPKQVVIKPKNITFAADALEVR
ncbi:phosphoribosylformylglycinamidine cyclo-ligase [Candidatus Saccharibacteria bacterium RIFCSPHIGHO2_12_FULL_47_17]|nr:MAG: phosphoribosylformylglycinamidine cyclo-ligase [Candidatus Saccharibacteria bacterium RIFCSPHIGHO2_12_FULL_47_17]